jgi:uncharacterized protein YabE (DUF348 family)
VISTRNLLSRLGTSKKLALQLTSALVISSSVGTAAYAGTKDSITIEVEGKKQTVRTHADTVGELLKDENITLNSEDKVYPTATSKLKDNMKVVVDKADLFTLNVNGKKKKVLSTAKTVQEFLEEQNIQLGEHDVVTPGKNKIIKKNDTITIERAFPVVLNVGGQEMQVWSTSITVADFLKKQNVTLNELDKVEPSKDQVVQANTVVKVTRVEKVTDVVEEAVPFATVKKQDGSLTAGTENIVQEGEEGKVQKTFEVIKENGIEVSRNVVQETKLKDSKDKIIAVGTKTEAADTPSRGNEDSAVADEFYVEATAYAAHPSENGTYGGRVLTATGMDLTANPNARVIAVDPNIIPLGSKVWVEGYGYAIAGDTGGAIKGHRIDVLMPNEGQASAWGRKRVKIRILK